MIVASTFYNNTATITGGVILTISSDILSIKGSEFIKILLQGLEECCLYPVATTSQ